MGTAIGALFEHEKISLNDLNGKTLGIDSYNIIYQFLSSIRGPDGSPLMDRKGNVTSHLTGLLYRTTNLMEKGIKPVFVFDGIPHSLKKETLMKRRKTRTEAIKKHEEAIKEGKLEEAKKLGSRALKLTDEMIADAKTLIELMGLPIVNAPSEGEAQIAHMVETGKVDGAVTQDYDALLFGTPLLYRNIAVTGKRKAPGRNFYVDIAPEKIELSKVCKELGVDRKKLIWIGILIGTDFNEKFPKIGPKTALKLVNNNSSFEDIIEETGHSPEFDYKDLEDLFLKPEISNDFEISFNLPKQKEIVEFLCNKHDFSEDRVKNAIGKIAEKASEKGKQSNLGSWI